MQQVRASDFSPFPNLILEPWLIYLQSFAYKRYRLGIYFVHVLGCERTGSVVREHTVFPVLRNVYL